MNAKSAVKQRDVYLFKWLNKQNRFVANVCEIAVPLMVLRSISKIVMTREMLIFDQRNEYARSNSNAVKFVCV